LDQVLVGGVRPADVESVHTDAVSAPLEAQ
jgi:hypothetical protein